MKRWRQTCELARVTTKSMHTNYMSINIYMYKNKNIEGCKCIVK